MPLFGRSHRLGRGRSGRIRAEPRVQPAVLKTGAALAAPAGNIILPRIRCDGFRRDLRRCRSRRSAFLGHSPSPSGAAASAPPLQQIDHRLGAALRQRLVGGGVANQIGVPGHFDLGLGATRQGRIDLADQGLRVVGDLGAAGFELDVLACRKPAQCRLAFSGAPAAGFRQGLGRGDGGGLLVGDDGAAALSAASLSAAALSAAAFSAAALASAAPGISATSLTMRIPGFCGCRRRWRRAWRRRPRSRPATRRARRCRHQGRCRRRRSLHRQQLLSGSFPSCPASAHRRNPDQSGDQERPRM